eukprot:968338-Amorphochlora_amoeboformis.AAC.1
MVSPPKPHKPQIHLRLAHPHHTSLQYTPPVANKWGWGGSECGLGLGLGLGLGAWTRVRGLD